ncbi:hypothetical protein NQ234_25970, partial [Escherichia coli]|nr:hypothetical protein [Escherichia coli]
LDIDLERSIVVVEWAAGMVESLTHSVLAITIERPTGAASSTPDRDDGDEIDGDEPIESRRVRIEGRGPRWAGVALDDPA